MTNTGICGRGRKKSNTLLDKNFLVNYPNGIKVRKDIYDLLMEILSKDLQTLESLQICDYSFLMGIHVVNGSNDPHEIITNL